MSWVQTAKVGDRVVCIDDAWFNDGTKGKPKKYDILTIRDIDVYKDRVGFRFKEIKNPPVLTVIGFIEKMFESTHFKPLDESRLDVFRRMLQHADA